MAKHPDMCRYYAFHIVHVDPAGRLEVPESWLSREPFSAIHDSELKQRYNSSTCLVCVRVPSSLYLHVVSFCEIHHGDVRTFTVVGYMDEVIGNVTSLLRKKGMWDNTLVVASSDNGGPLCE